MRTVNLQHQEGVVGTMGRRRVIQAQGCSDWSSAARALRGGRMQRLGLRRAQFLREVRLPLHVLQLEPSLPKE